jgi:hypothetical protein
VDNDIISYTRVSRGHRSGRLITIPGTQLIGVVTRCLSPV